MKYLLKKVSYLSGLADGMDLDDSNESRLLLEVIDVLNDFAEVMDETVEAQVQMQEAIDLLDEDLAELEEFVYDEEDYDYDDEFDYDDDFEFEDLDFDDEVECECGCGCGCEHTEE